MRVLTWNLFHGRSVPATPTSLADHFTALIASWEWEVALLQEVPPWWPARLAAAAGAEQRTVLTSRNSLLGLRRALAARRPELMKSNGGGSNAVLSRVGITEHRILRLRLWPERRVAQLVRLGEGSCVANFHGSARVPLAEEELEVLWAEATAWAGTDPLILGGDLNLREPGVPDPGVLHVAERDVDHLFASGPLVQLEQAELLDRHIDLGGGAVVELSDHPPLRVSLRVSAEGPLA
jgi:endonuclease/exonuclease/phosphatase family metal-dependent hydrolase